MSRTAWDMAGLSYSYWLKHSVDVRMRLAAAPYMLGWRYRAGSPSVAYPLPPQVKVSGLYDPKDRATNCSTMTTSLLMSVFADAPWTAQEYGDLQVFAGRDLDAPIQAVLRMGVGVRMLNGAFVPRYWHLVQGWRRLGDSPSGHAFLARREMQGLTVLESSSQQGNIGPRYRRTTAAQLRQEFPAQLHVARLQGP